MILHSEKLLNFIISANLSYSIVENSFLLKLLDKENIFSADTARNKLIAMFEDRKERLKSYFASVSSKISFTLDIWTSNSTISYLGFFRIIFYFILF